MSNVADLYPLEKRDIQKLRKIRNEQIRYLRQKTPISPEEQERWYEGYISAPSPKKNILFVFEEGSHIGVCGLTNIDYIVRRAELSYITSIPDTVEDYRSVFLDYVRELCRIAFKDMGLKTVFAETYENRPLHIELLQKAGFTTDGKMRNATYYDGKFIDSVCQSITSEEYDEHF